ncbi:MAG TPA: M17 family peptidase N-terminal domain-containing protein, partial [Nitrospira sp.]|nr:M17 family peptidase N-terminal domain-containing protein [Nitrospira sp.]
MKIMQVDVKVGRAEAESAEVLVLTHCEEEGLSKQDAVAIDKVLGGSLRDLLQSKEFEGKTGEILVYHTHGKVPAKRLLLVGLGKKKDLTLDTIRQAMGHAVKRVRQSKVGAFTASVPTVTPKGHSPIEVAQAMVEGAILGNYQFTDYRSDNGVGKDVGRMTVLAQQKGQVRQLTEGIRRGIATAEAAVLVRDLCNHPSNVMTPSRIAGEAKTVAKDEGLTLKILEQKDMEHLGMGALLGVARGSHEPPKFIILEYNGSKKKDERPVVFIGKTITFDTGGISLKPPAKMEDMKGDMAGGAGTMHGIGAVAALGLPVRAIAVLAAAE